MECPECNKEIEQTDTTYSNTETKRAYFNQHTGNIYWCEDCQIHWLENLLEDGKIERFYY